MARADSSWPLQPATLLVGAGVPLLALFGALMGLALTSRTFLLSLDWRAFYTAGRIVRGGAGGHLYDVAVQAAWQRAWVPELVLDGDLNPFRNPPFVAAPLAVLAALPPEWAYVAWTVLTTLLLGVVAWQAAGALSGAADRARLLALPLVVTFFPLVVATMHGQLSALLVVGLLGAWRSLRRGLDARAGLWLALLLVKPQMAVLVVLILAWKRRWRALAALAGTAVLLAVISLALVGVDGVRGFMELSLNTLGWNDLLALSPRRTHTWRGFLHLLLATDDAATVQPWWLLGVAAALVGLGWAWRGPWRARARAGRAFDLQWAALAVATLLTSPYTNFHDVALLVPAGVLAVRAVGPRGAWLALSGYGVVFLTLPLAAMVPVQASVLTSATAFVLLTRCAARTRAVEGAVP